MCIRDRLVGVDVGTITEDDIEEWIHSWYKEIYDKTPPIWLAGSRWYDRRDRKIKEAEENEV